MDQKATPVLNVKEKTCLLLIIIRLLRGLANTCSFIPNENFRVTQFYMHGWKYFAGVKNAHNLSWMLSYFTSKTGTALAFVTSLEISYVWQCRIGPKHLQRFISSSAGSRSITIKLGHWWANRTNVRSAKFRDKRTRDELSEIKLPHATPKSLVKRCQDMTEVVTTWTQVLSLFLPCRSLFQVGAKLIFAIARVPRKANKQTNNSSIFTPRFSV